MYTVIVVAASNAYPVKGQAGAGAQDKALQHLNMMAALSTIQALGMSSVLVSDDASGSSSGLLTPPWPKSTSITLQPTGCAINLASSLIAGIEASPHADGWLLMPAHLPPPSLETVKRVCEALALQQIAYPVFHDERGTPIGFGKELFSELMHLRTNHDVLRLMSRYPSQPVEVDTPLTPAEDWIEGVQHRPLRGISPLPH